MTTPLIKMSAEFLSLREMLAKLEQTVEDQETSSDPEEEEREAITEPMLDRMSELARSIVQTRAHTPEELAQKARIVLDWINEDGDLADVLSASLCHDVVALFRDHAHT
jgi:hypothetical protein